MLGVHDECDVRGVHGISDMALKTVILVVTILISNKYPKVSIIQIVAEPKLFVAVPAPAPTFKKFPLRRGLRLRLQLKLCGYGTCFHSF